MTNEKKEEVGAFSSIFTMASEMTQISMLGHFKNIIAKIGKESFYSFEKDIVVENTYHILYKKECIITLKSDDIRAITQYVQVLQYGFNHGASYVLESMVNKIAAKTIK